MKILYFTDLHSQGLKKTIEKYDYSIDAIKKEKPDIVINGGDMLPKVGLSFEKIDNFMNDYLEKYFKAINELNIPHLLMFGNDDFVVYDEILTKMLKKYKHIYDIAFNKIKLKEFDFIGFNLVKDYPFTAKDRCRRDAENFIFPMQLGKGILTINKNNNKDYKILEDWIDYSLSLPTMKEELNNLIQPDDYKKSIYIIHEPPANLKLDVCNDGKEVGSKSVFDFIRANKPFLTLHGHIHETARRGRWFNFIDDTLCIQPGQEKAFVYTVINIKNGEDLYYARKTLGDL